ncbi:ABC-2 type transport system permease protein [Nocardiopsis sp. Huas11]|uniref:ABC transporter permease n=1 Tax=Nocardiopsis sp. Huas11 TaxID=2183912 RepID=UPI000EACF93E|nr:ABC transporter permease [Nocardiopsis sp. Huas11]RKS10552.1 ABC-2 type transport system permease protein [Nocardiopsis sp. Huas11]
MSTGTSPTEAVPDARPAASPRLPGPLRVGLARGWMEVREFAREWESVVFTFTLPSLVLLLFGVIFDGAFDADMPAVDFYLPGLIAMGLMSVSFQTLGVGIAVERDRGGLRRLRGTPMPPTAYFLGKTVLVLFLALAQLVLLMGVAALVHGAAMPRDAAAWATMAWVFLLGTVACAMLGTAASSLARNARTASGIVVVPFLVLQFISGIFVPIMVLPGWVVDVASLFPLKWMAQGMRAAFYPDQMRVLEPSGGWDLPMVALALGAWCVVGLVLTLATFRWKTRKDG